MALEVAAFSFKSWLTKRNFRGATQKLWFVYDAVEMQEIAMRGPWSQSAAPIFCF
jgi:hypothetical protein